MDTVCLLIYMILEMSGTAPLAKPVLRTLHKWRRRYLLRRARAWPLASGRVFARADNSPDLGWTVALHYSYVVDGEYYGGNDELSAADEYEANEWVSRLKDRSVPVRYSPENPSKSVIVLDQ